MGLNGVNHKHNIFSGKLFLVWGLIILGLICFPSIIRAHNSGFFIEKIVGEYLLDVGYSSAVLVEDSQVRFDFAIYDSNKTQEINFSEVWVRIEKDEKLLFAGGLNKARFGATGLVYNFPEGGNYQISTRFSGATSTLAETQFDFTVIPIEIPLTQQLWFKAVLYTSLAWSLLVLLIIIFLLIKPKHKHKNKFETEVSLGLLKSIKSVKRNTVINILLGLVFVALGYGLAYFFTKQLDLSVLRNFEIFNKAAAENTIWLTDEGFSPSELTIPVGTTVTFNNGTDKPFWPASNLHPTHEIYPEFNPNETIESGGSWSFKFNKFGSWAYHDHIRSYYIGTINVTPL